MIDLAKLQSGTLPAFLFVVALAGPAIAQQPGACAQFEAKAHMDKITFHDQGEEGTSYGDRRILRWQLNDANDDAPIGTAHAITTVMHSETQGEHPVMTDAVLVMETGSIFITILSTLTDPSVTDRSLATPFEWAVIGGTGTFAGAQGTMTTNPRDDGVVDMSLDIGCSQ